MTKDKALQIVFVGLSATSRRLEDIFADHPGQDIIGEACEALEISKDKFYEMQAEYLDLRNDVNDLMKSFVNRMFKKEFNEKAPTWREIFDSVSED